MRITAPAKVNLTLNVLGTRPDGYHDLCSVVQTVSLCDTVILEPAGDVGDASALALGERNLTVKAARALQRAAGVRHGVRIGLEKRIPAGAGLGGGSADAAAVLRGLNAMWGLGWDTARLCAVAAEVGSDVPALVLGGTVLMEGRGERVRPYRLEPPDPRAFVICKPDVFASTPAIYGAFRPEDRGKGPNDLQPAACRLCPEIAGACAALTAAGAQDVRMTGSGAAVFGRAEDLASARTIAARLPGAWAVEAVGC